jgi:hypothetical protein
MYFFLAGNKYKKKRSEIKQALFHTAENQNKDTLIKIMTRVP